MWAVVLLCTCRPGRPGLAAVALAAVGAAAACNTAAQVQLVPLGGACARPATANAVKITAYAADGEHSESVALDEALAIADFPADTEQLAIEVLVGGGEIGAAGKSAPLAFGGLGDGAQIAVFMAPPDGFCAVGAMTEPRAQPLVARAGNGVLVVGGAGPGGPLSTAEYYDPATAAFSAVEVPGVLADPQGFTGTALATLPDGNVALIGGPQHAFVVFDPAARAFTAAPTLIDSRAFHAAIATEDGDVVVAGGCVSVVDGACDGHPRGQLLRYHPSQLGEPDRDLPTTLDLRIGAKLFDLGIQVDGRRGYLLAGGTGDPPGGTDRFALDDPMTTPGPGSEVQPAALDGGAVLTAFAEDSAAASGAASVISPGPGPVAARPIASAPPRVGARLIALEDGRVAAFGGDPAGAVQLYDAMRDAWVASPGPAGPALIAPSLVRLGDGSVLVVGGDASGASASAWLYRPSLVGPAAGSVTAVPVSGLGRGVLTAPDPATVTRGDAPAEWRLGAIDDTLAARALVGGPRTATGSIRAIATVRAGGVALIARQTGPGHALAAELVPGQPPQLVALDAGAARVVCTGTAAVAAFDAAVAATLRLAITDGAAELSRDGSVVLRCDLPSPVAADRGAWGIAALGAGAAVAVASVTVARGTASP